MELLLEQLVDELVVGGEALFRKRHAEPALVCFDLPPDDEDDERDYFTMSADWQKLRETLELRPPRAPTIPPPTSASAPPASGRTTVKVFPVRKRAGGAFEERIGVGRATNADVSIPLPALSKYHAYFTVPETPGTDYTLTDADSKNGTWVEGQRLTAKESATVADGTEIRLGPYRMTFHTPDGLLERVRRAARLR